MGTLANQPDPAAEVSALRAELAELRQQYEVLAKDVRDIKTGIEDVYSRLPCPPGPRPDKRTEKRMRAADLGLVALPGGAA